MEHDMITADFTGFLLGKGLLIRGLWVGGQVRDAVSRDMVSCYYSGNTPSFSLGRTEMEYPHILYSISKDMEVKFVKPSLKMSRKRSAAHIRQFVVFRFPRIAPGESVVTESFRLRNIVNTGEVIVSQRPASSSTATPVVRYQIVDAATGRPITNSVTVTGTRTAVLPFIVPAGTDRLQIRNVGAGSVTVQGVILVF